MNEYLRLLSQASINDTSKFHLVDSERPKTRGRPPKYYHPLLQKEKELETLVRKILLKSIADALRPKGSRLAHLYGWRHIKNSWRYGQYSLLLKFFASEMAWRQIKTLVVQSIYSDRHIPLCWWSTRARDQERRNFSFLWRHFIIYKRTLGGNNTDHSWKSFCPRLVQRDTQLEPL